LKSYQNDIKANNSKCLKNVKICKKLAKVVSFTNFCFSDVLKQFVFCEMLTLTFSFMFFTKVKIAEQVELS